MAAPKYRSFQEQWSRVHQRARKVQATMEAGERTDFYSLRNADNLLLTLQSTASAYLSQLGNPSPPAT